RRRAATLGRRFFAPREAPDALPAGARWAAILADADAPRRRTARRALAGALGELFRRLHAAGLYHNDLKDVNVLVTGPSAAPRCVLLDLENVRALPRVSRRRRGEDPVQPARTPGPPAAPPQRAPLPP